MTRHDQQPERSNVQKSRTHRFLTTPAGLALCTLLAVAGVFLWIDHRVHIIWALPFLLPLLICLGMHFFMHRGHGASSDE